MAIGPGQTLGGRNGVSIYMIIHKSAAFLLRMNTYMYFSNLSCSRAPPECA